MTLEDVTHILDLLVSGEPVLGRTDSSHQFLVENCIACFSQELGPQDHVLGKVNLAWVRWCRDTKPCDMWSHWCQHTRYTQKSTAHFRRGLNDMEVDDFIWRLYMRVGVLEYLAVNMFMCSTKSPLMSFECIKWHLTDRIRRQFGLQQLPLNPTFEIGCDHCRRLTGPQNHDWRDRNIQWVNLWISGRYNTLQLGDEIVDLHHLPVYYDCYT
ncbi:hypothetical protein Ahy_A08g037781 [Arachis hypogaea]|uniref:Aminotransferase-like plant mobile domain-containing protein n=1 Tax=Arachis hypogaea TaxID=3818 RepID=A0A445BRS6_ARAHY|nr:hypothetical protein Ahy_A08g037781 [Arachis hypogaea]